MLYAMIKVVGHDLIVGPGTYGEMKVHSSFTPSLLMPVDMAHKECDKANRFNNPTDKGLLVSEEYYSSGFEVIEATITFK